MSQVKLSVTVVALLAFITATSFTYWITRKDRDWMSLADEKDRS